MTQRDPNFWQAPCLFLPRYRRGHQFTPVYAQPWHLNQPLSRRLMFHRVSAEFMIVPRCQRYQFHYAGDVSIFCSQCAQHGIFFKACAA